MEKSRANWLIVRLVAAHAALHAAALSMVLGRGQPDGESWLYETVLYALFMLGPSQAVLLALWLAFGGGKFVWRGLALVLGSFVYAVSLPRVDPDWLPLTVGEMWVCGIAFLIARSAGVRLTRYSDPKPASGPFQFYIRDMVFWTTAVAVALSVWKCLPKDVLRFTLRFALQRPLYEIAIFESITLVGIVSLYSALGRRWLVARIALVPTAVIVAAFWLDKTIPRFSYFASLFSLMAAWLVVSLLVVRHAGYHFAWRPWRGEPRAA